MLISSRANTILLVLILAVGIGIVAMLATRSAAGPLDPPGAPSSTSGVLRPGTAITTLPYTISAPGNYYLTKNLAGLANQNGITVAADDATIDLGGFVMTGSGGTGYGIAVNGGVNGTRITNGVLKQWQLGIAAYGSGYTTVTDLQARSNSQGGIYLSAHGSIERCNASGNGLGSASGYGIRVSYTSVKDCVVTDNHVYGIWVEADSDIASSYTRNNGHDVPCPWRVSAPCVGVFVTGNGSTIHDSYMCDGVAVGDGVTSTDYDVVRDNTVGWWGNFGATNTFLSVADPGSSPSWLAPDLNNIEEIGC